MLTRFARSSVVHASLAALLLAALPACGLPAPEEAAALDETALSGAPLATASALSSTCTTTGGFTTGWLYTGDGYDFARARLSWSGDSAGGSGSLTVTASLDGFAYTSYTTMAATGVIKVNGKVCGTVSFVDRTPMEGSGSTTCTVAVSNVSSYTITVADSAAGARWEILRGTDNNQFHAVVSANQSNGTVQCF